MDSVYNLSHQRPEIMNLTSFSGTNFTALEGHIITRSYNPGLLVLSYMISYVGAWTTLELLHRRTAWKGSYNWWLLVGASISMGGIATWCMHFIGTRAIILGNGDPTIQIAYSQGFTTLSFFVPIIVLLISFCTVGSSEHVNIVRVSLGGTLSGLGFSVMVYLGQAGILNYTCIYVVSYVLSAAIIACLASIGALGTLSYFRSNWNSSWWKRALSATLLSFGVYGMHWLSVAGTEYQLKQVDGWPMSSGSKESTVIGVISLSICGCIALVFISVFAQAQRARTANRAQQVVLATAIFDPDGKVLVTPNGIFPNRKITQQFLERSFNDVFNASHPVFLWIYRTTHNWQGVEYLLPTMRRHIDAAGLGHRHLRSTSQANLMDETGAPVEDYSIIFRELFCLAAFDLAIHLGRELEEMGVLYEEITPTGHKSFASANGKKSLATLGTRLTRERKTVDAERATARDEVEVMGKGQLLFLVSKVDKVEAGNLTAAGYRFAAKENVLPMLSASLQIGQSDISRRLDLMIDYVGNSHILEPGIHIAGFAIRASIGAGFDVLARRDAKNLLPTMQLGIDALEPAHLEYMKTMDLLSVGAVMKLFNKATKANNPNKDQREFAKAMNLSLEALKDEIDDPFFNDAQLIAKPVEAPCRGRGGDGAIGVALLITFKIIVPIHARAPGKKLVFVPLNLFRTQQRVYKGSPDHNTFARETFKEFSKVLDMTGVDEDGYTRVNSYNKSKFTLRKGNSSFNGKSAKGMAGVNADGTRPSESSGPTLKPPVIKFWSDKGRNKGRDDQGSDKGLLSDSEQNSTIGEEVGIDPRDSDRTGAPGSINGEKGIEMSRLNSGGQGPKFEVAKPAPKDEGEKRTFIDEMFAITIKTKEGAKV